MRSEDDRRGSDAMPRNDGAVKKEAHRHPKRRPFIVQAVLIGVGIALVPLAGLGILFLKKVTAKPSDSQEDAESIIKKYSRLIDDYTRTNGG